MGKHFGGGRGKGTHIGAITKSGTSFCKYELKRPKKELLKIKKEVLNGLQHIIKNKLLVNDFRNIDTEHVLSIVYYDKRGEYVINKKFVPNLSYNEALEKMLKGYKEVNKYKFDVPSFDDAFAKLLDVYDSEDLAKFYDYGINTFGKEFETYTNILLNLEIDEGIEYV